MDLIVWITRTSLIFGFFLLNGTSTAEKDKVLSSDLHSYLIEDYKAQLIPICEVGKIVNITFDIALRQIITLNEKDQVLTTNVWIRMSWTDCRLMWNVSEYNDVREIFVPYSEVWSPGLALYDSSAEEEMMPGSSDYRARVQYDGRVQYNFPTVLKSICRVKVTYFPFDTQTCSLKFGSWSYSLKDLDFHSSDTSTGMNGDLRDFVKNNEWDVSKLVPERAVKPYENNTVFYTEIEYKIYMHRRPAFYVMTMMFPCILVSAIASVGFLLPSESGEKVSLEVTVLLSQAVFLLVISDFLPPSAETFPVIGTYFAVSMLLVCMSLVLSVLVLNVHHRGDIHGRTVPRWAKLFVNLIDRCCRYKDDYDMKQSSSTGTADTSVSCSNRRPDVATDERDDIDKYLLKDSTFGEEPRVNGGGDHIMNHLPTATRHRLPPLRSSGSVQSEAIQIYMQEQTDTLNNIMHHFEDTDNSEENKEDWQKLARVLDRIFLLLYIVCFAAITLGFILKLKLHDT